MKILVKLGGTLLDHEETRRQVAGQLRDLHQVYTNLVVVHGGGKQMTRFLAERGVESRFVNGLRVTTPEVVDAVLKVFTGTVNRQLVSSLVKAGLPAVGLSGIDACLVEAEQLSPDLGAVGRPVKSNPALFETLITGGFLPVVACVAGDRQGTIFNVNADQMAVACAVGFGADRLFFLTDVDGVRDGDGNIVRHLHIADGERLISTGVATGGMEAKLNSAHHALRQGVPQVWIAPGAQPDVLARLVAGEELGSRLSP